MSIPYNELARRAKDEINGLEEPLRNIAFQIIFQDLILENKRNAQKEPKQHASSISPENVEDPVAIFMTNVVEAGDYVKLFAANGKLIVKCLAVLKIAKDQLGIDGLSAVQLSQILTRKFRVSKVHASNVARDLSKATMFVNRIQHDGEYRYILMLTGEQAIQEELSALR